MATSPNYGWLEPDNTDLVKNGALAIRTLGNAIDTTMATMTPKSTVTTKGDLVAATAASTPARLAVGNNGETLVADSSTSTGLRWQGTQIAGKNAVINGAMDFFQRSSTPTTGSAITGGGYLLDRWAGYRAVAGSTCSRQVTNDTTNLPFIQYCARVQRDSANTSTSNISIGQSIETSNTIPYVGRIVTVSFYARAGANFSAASSTLGIRLLSSTSVDTSIILNGGTSVITSTATLTTTWQRFTFTSAAAVGTNANTLGVLFDYTPVGTAGAADFFEVTGVQLEIGSVATTFARNGGTIQGELAACQRYYFRSSGGSNYAFTGINGMGNTTTQMMGFFSYPVAMRIAPSSVDYSNIAIYDTVTVLAVSSITISDATTTGIRVLVNTATASVQAWRPNFVINNNNTAGYLALNAEL